MKRVTLDFETRGAGPDLKKVGAYLYSLHPTTRPTCLTFKLHGFRKIHLLRFEEIYRPWNEQAPEFRGVWKALINQGYLFTAHNAFFEKCIYVNIMVARLGWPAIPVDRWRCTAAKAAACALPRALEKVADALKLATRKDRRGYSAMMATCKPTKRHAAWRKAREEIAAGKKVGPKKLDLAAQPEPPLFLEPDTAPEVFEVLYEYCGIDTLAEENLDDVLPDLPKEEQEIWHLNQLINWRGLRVDIPTVKKIVGMMEEESTKKLKELDRLTMGLVRKPGARKSILEFLALEGIELPDLRAATVERKLEGFDMSPDMQRLLEIRKALSMTSTRKYHSFLARAAGDDRVRDLTMYHGASTGRDTGTGIQPHNFPRGVIFVDKRRPYATVDNVATLDPSMLRLLYGESLPLVFSSILRNMIIPTEGYDLYVADFSKVEVAVLWWLAGNKPGLEILRAGLDPYIYMAAANTGRAYQDFNDQSPERQLGKVQVLGCGFGMGAPRFKEAAGAPPYRLKLSDEQSVVAVQNYRRANAAVPQLWKDYEAAAVAAVECPGDTQEAGHCYFFVEDKFLWVELPSGRRLAYREPQIAWRETEWGPRKTLEFWAVNSKTKQWSIERTWGGTLTENIVQGTARDLMMRGIVALEKAGYRALLTVHDEALCEKKKGTGNLDEFVRILCKLPPWAPGLPLEAKGWCGPRYRK